MHHQSAKAGACDVMPKLKRGGQRRNAASVCQREIAVRAARMRRVRLANEAAIQHELAPLLALKCGMIGGMQQWL